MEFESKNNLRGPEPDIENVALVEYNGKYYLGWVPEDFTPADDFEFYDSVEVAPGPTVADRASTSTTPTDIRGELVMIMPTHDLPKIRHFPSYDSIQTFGHEAAITQLYKSARAHLFSMKVIVKPQLIRKERPTNGTR